MLLGPPLAEQVNVILSLSLTVAACGSITELPLGETIQ